MSATFAAMQVIRYARTRHLTITTRVSRFVLLHTAPVLRRRRSLLRNVQQPPDEAAPNQHSSIRGAHVRGPNLRSGLKRMPYAESATTCSADNAARFDP